MRLDQSRHADHAAAVDHLGAGRGHVGGNRDDRAVAHMHVAARQIADARVHRQHVGAAHDELAARGQRAGPGALRERTAGRRLAAPSAVAAASTARRLIVLLLMIAPG